MAKIQVDQKKIIESYKEKFGVPKISHEINDDDIKITYIETNRFTASSLYSKKDKFDDYEESLQNLYKLTFGDPVVVEKYGDGKGKTPEEFQTFVNMHSLRWGKGYQFAAFIVENSENDEVAGFGVLGNGYSMALNASIDNTSEMAGALAKKFHRNDKIQNVGAECAFALVSGYGQQLYDDKEMVNQSYDKEQDKFIGGTVFKKILATARYDNPASQKIQEHLGFVKIAENEKDGHMRVFYEKNFELENPEQEVIGDIGKEVVDE